MGLIEFASSQAGHTTVCVLAHEEELIPLEQRSLWLNATYGDRTDITVCALSYDRNELNESSKSDLQSSIEWADFLKERFGLKFSDFDVIIGSERYVQYMANYLGISHLIYDEHRTELPISATNIKNDIVRFWDYLAPAVKQTYATHICICGSESTGKSTTCKRLEEDLNYVTIIPELGRCLVGKSAICSEATLRKIYELHLPLLEAIKQDPPTPIMLWDTDNITTLSYYGFLFPHARPQFNKIPKADKYFFFESNISFKDDGTRFEESEALKLRNHHLSTYLSQGIQPELITCNNRYDIVENYIKSAIETLKKHFR